MKSILFIIMLALTMVIGFEQSASAQMPSDKTSKEFQATLDKIDAAQIEFHNGHPDAVKGLWSHTGDVTLAGGAGGPIEKGWDNVSKRLDWASSHYEKGVQTNERIMMNISGDFGYVVQYEHIHFQVPGQENKSVRDYRITMVLRREAKGWRIVHRQADTQTVAQLPK